MEKIYTTREIERMKNRIKNLQWDGKDHIGELAKYIKAKNVDFGKEIESIDFNYIKNVNITDIYAQAYHSYKTYLSRTIDFES